jgi:enoyl-CoA hydratase/carnithine racemase
LSGGTVRIDLPAPGIRRLRIHNEEQRGALSEPVLTALRVGIEEAPADTRCLILAGSGPTFCAGYDLRALGVPPAAEQAEETIAPTSVELFETIESQDLPIVAAVNGPVFGGGIELLFACDLRVAVPGASLHVPAGRLGLVYSPGAIERLNAELPFAIAAELFLTAGGIAAERAAALGLINRIVAPPDLDQASLEVARTVAELARLSVSANRRALRDLRRAAARLTGPDRARFTLQRQASLHSADFAEGVSAFRGRRPPHFPSVARTAESGSWQTNRDVLTDD